MVKRAADSELLTAIRTVREGRSFVSPMLAEAEAQEPPETQTGLQTFDAAGVALERLSARERQVLVLLAHGHTHAEMAEQLGISVKTVETHRARLSEKLGLKSRADLVRLALAAGLLA